LDFSFTSAFPHNYGSDTTAVHTVDNIWHYHQTAVINTMIVL